MEKLYRLIVKNPKKILLAFLAALVFCLLEIPLIGVDYDLNDYLPQSAPSSIALDVMDEEFDGGIPNCRVMLQNVTVAEALAFKEKLKAMDGVDEVTWLDDSVDLTEPLEYYDPDIVDNYYKDGTALFSVTIDEAYYNVVVPNIQEMVGEDGCVGGAAASQAISIIQTAKEVPLITVVSVIYVLFILILTTDNWVEPFVVLASLGVAIGINVGSNIIFGTISFVTNSSGNVLQLAVSLDYSIFLIHRFEEMRKIYSDNDEALVKALAKSTSSILSSGLTTVIGFIALCLMRFRIGPDMGLALAKGVCISLLTCFAFSPVLIKYTVGLMDKTRHRPFIPKFDLVARIIQKVMIPLAIVFVIVIVPARRASDSNSYYYGSSHIFGTKTRLGSDEAKIDATFGKSDTYVILVPRGDFAAEQKMSEEIQAFPEVSDVISYVDSAGVSIPTDYVAKNLRDKLLSEHYSRLVVSVEVEREGDNAFALVEKIREVCQKYYPDTWLMAGEGVNTLDLKDTVTADNLKVNLIAIGAVFVVLLFSLRSLLLPVVLVLAIEASIWINLSFPYFRGQIVFYIGYLIISSVQLGATVDYAILFTERYTDNRHTMSRRDSITEMIESCSVSMLTSGSAMTIIGLAMGVVSTHGVLSQLGTYLGRGALMSMVIVQFILPGLLYLLDKPIQWTTLGAKYISDKDAEAAKKAAAEKTEEIPGGNQNEA